MRSIRILCSVAAILLILVIVQGVQAAEVYGYVTQWGTKGSDDGQFINPWGLATDSSRNVYVVDTGTDWLQKFDSNGTFLTRWGGPWTDENRSDGNFIGPVGIAIDSSDNLFVLDSMPRVQKFTSDGIFIKRLFSGGGVENGQFWSPLGLALDPLGNIYVADTMNNRIQKFDSNGNFITKWGSFGSGDGQFDEPSAIAIDHFGYVYVADSLNDRIQKFDSSGNYITKWQGVVPFGICADSSGNIFVPDDNTGSIYKFDSNLTFLTKWGSLGSGNGQFMNPMGIAVDSTGNVYVSDAGNHRIQKFALTSSGNISLTSEPEGAEIYLDGIDARQITPFTLTKIPSGNHQVSVILAGYEEPSLIDVTVTANDTASVDFSLVPIPSGSINITSTPSGAKIFVDNSITFQVTPYTMSHVYIGNHSVFVTLAGYQMPQAKTVTVTAGQQSDVDFQLIPDNNSLSVNSTPLGAECYINGIDTGHVTPWTFYQIQPGSYSVDVKLKGYINGIANTVQVASNTATTQNFVLAPYIPEFPSPTLPAIIIIGLFCTVLVIKRTREQ